MTASTKANSALQIANSFGISYFTLDRELVFIEYDPNFARLVGWTGAQAGNPDYLDIFPSDANSFALEQILRALYVPQNLLFEDFCSTLNLWLKFRLTSDGSKIFGSIEDITAEHKNQAVEDSTVTGLAAVIADAGMGIARLRLDGRWDFVNPRGQEILGYTEAQLREQSFDDVCRSDLRERESLNFVELIRGERNLITSETCIINSAGVSSWIHLNISLVHNSNGQADSFALIFHDIGDRKASDESLKFALEAAQMAEWDYDATSDETRRSDRFNEIFGVDSNKSNWSFHDFLEHTLPEDRATLAQAFRNAITGGEELNVEIRPLRPDTDPRWISLRGKAYLNHQGRVVRMAGLVTDITNKKSVAIDLHNAKLAAEDANREKSYFLANMSHEIRTPLGAILGFADVLRDLNLPSDARTRYLEILTRNGLSLAALIDDILDLSKVESGHLEIINSNCNLRDVISDIVSLLRIKADAKNLEILVGYAADVPSVILIDMIRLRQILINIIGNAIKFTSHGRILIAVKGGDAKGVLSIRVHDTGPGMTTNQSARLFQPFMQADSSTSRKFGGTGLGLALSRRLSRAMGGELCLENSVPGEGSTFLLCLPLVAVEKSPTEVIALAPANTAVREIEGLKILLAEDSPDNQELIKLMLDRLGVSTCFADDGSIAVKRALGEDFDLVLMDMQMPGLDGYAATRTLRKAGYSKPIIALTANAMRHDRDRCLSAGCTDYMSKPIDPECLRRLIGINAGSAYSH